MMSQRCSFAGLEVGGGAPLLLIAGPCVLEDLDTALEVAHAMSRAAASVGMGYVFKASFDKANRTSISSYRGPGLDRGIKMLAEIKERAGVPVVTDIHLPEQAEAVGEVADILQIPAFLCRQTDLLIAAARTGVPVNIKKGQFLAPWDMAHPLAKVREAGGRVVMLTERGSCFGYNNLVVDMRGLGVMRALGAPVIFDATHSVQLPGASKADGEVACSGGERHHVPALARAAVAAGVDGVFMEVHPEPDKALCDGPNSMFLEGAAALLGQLAAIRGALAHGNEVALEE